MEAQSLAASFAHTAVPTAFTPDTTAVAGSLAASALTALVPLAVFFVLLGVVRVRAHLAGLGALGAALVIAVVGFHMPPGLALLSASQGAVFALFPVMWIVVMAVWLYQITVVSGRFEDLRSVFDRVGGGDLRIQAMLIAFCFGGLLEALAGFGAPVAITGTMVMALGLPPLRAAVTVLVANTAPVAFGAMAIPITTAANLTGLDPHHIAAIVGRQTPILAAFVPLLLVFLVDGRRGFKETWPVALVTGLAFGVAQYYSSNHFAYELTDIIAALTGLAAAIVFLRFWSPRHRLRPEGLDAREEPLGAPGPRTGFSGEGRTVQAAARGTQTVTAPDRELTGSRVVMALLPYLLVIVVFGVAKLWRLGVDVPAWLDSTTQKIQWPGLFGQLIGADGQPSTSAVYKFEWLASPGTLLLITALIVTFVYSTVTHGGRFTLSPGQSLRALGTTVVNMRLSILTVCTVIALGYVMNQSGQTVSIGVWFAAAGGFFAFLSPILGWLGTAVTGSDTSAQALFAKLQQAAAAKAGIDPNLLVAANSSGGVVGKLVSPQNLTIAATAVKQPGSESVLLRRVIGYSLGMLLVLCVLVYLQSTPVLSWMLP